MNGKVGITFGVPHKVCVKGHLIGPMVSQSQDASITSIESHIDHIVLVGGRDYVVSTNASDFF